MKQLTKEGLDRYRDHGVDPGDFLTAVLSNDLTRSVARADKENLADLHEIVAYCHNQLPRTCWGTPMKVEAWMNDHEMASVP